MDVENCLVADGLSPEPWSCGLSLTITFGILLSCFGCLDDVAS